MGTDSVDDMGLGALNAGDNCEFFRIQRDYEARMLHRVNLVIFSIVVVVAVSLVAVIIGIVIAAWSVAVAAFLGTAVSGAAMRFILDQRSEHAKRIDRWVRAIERSGCADIPPTA